MTLATAPIDFKLPEENISRRPAEHRNRSRDQVRLMVVARASRDIRHLQFPDLAHHLDPGDVVVVNNSGTLPAALPATTPAGDELLLHVASPAGGGLWSVELRTPTKLGGSSPGPDPDFDTLRLPGGRSARLLARDGESLRLWLALFDGVHDMKSYLQRFGRPIRYEAGSPLPIDDYQTVFARHSGSAEMPSAGRPFTDGLVTQLVAKGVVVVPITLHSGVSSFEAGESPGDERYEVPEASAAVINSLRSNGGLVIAVGTTVVRALESVVDAKGQVHPGRGVTNVIISSRRGVAAVDGLLTGWHEPRSSHLDLLEAFLDRGLLESVYDRAISEGYLWHEFGDELLILP